MATAFVVSFRVPTPNARPLSKNTVFLCYPSRKGEKNALF